MTQIPLFQPPSEWLPPERIPELREAKEIAIDLETCDPELVKHGPGWPTKKGKVIGIAIATASFKAYYPIGHEGGGNMDEKKVVRYIKSICDDKSISSDIDFSSSTDTADHCLSFLLMVPFGCLSPAQVSLV